MTVQLLTALRQLNQSIFALGALVQQNAQRAVDSILNQDPILAKQVIDADDAIDASEVEIEEDGLRVLALYQPVAHDLRYVVAALKVNNELERIGDIAVNVAERAIILSLHPQHRLLDKLRQMCSSVLDMLQLSLDAFSQQDTLLARKVCAADDIVDQLNRDLFSEACDRAHFHPEELDVLIQIMGAARHLERLADLTTNIAENVVYMVSGSIIRHHLDDPPKTIAPEPNTTK